MEVSFEKEYPVDAAPGAVWTFLNDFDAIGDCIPGVMDYTINGTHITSDISPPFSFLKGLFTSESDVSVVEEGEEMRVEMEGKSIGGSFTLTMDITVAEADDGTSLRLDVNAETHGLFKPVPQSVAQGVVNRIEDQMITCLRGHVE